MAQFTKRAIMEAFIKLLGEHPLDKITVKDIVEECGVNRNTFYYYFQDIYDLLDQLFQTELNRVLDEHRDFSTWHEAFLESVQFVFENKTAVRHLYTSLNREQLERYLYGVVDRVMLNFVQKKSRGAESNDRGSAVCGGFLQVCDCRHDPGVDLLGNEIRFCGTDQPAGSPVPRQHPAGIGAQRRAGRL